MRIANRAPDPMGLTQWTTWKASAVKAADGKHYTYTIQDGMDYGGVHVITGLPVGDWIITVYAEDWTDPALYSEQVGLVKLDESTTRWARYRFKNTAVATVDVLLKPEGRPTVTPLLAGVYAYADYQMMRNKLGLAHYAKTDMRIIL